MARRTRVRIAAGILEWGMRHPVFGRAADAYTPSFLAPREDGLSPATIREFEDGDGFFARFAGVASGEDLRGRDVLDLGCGYGGRTAFYADRFAPRSIVGVEIAREIVAAARDSTARLTSHPRVHYVAAIGEALPFADASFDVVLSYDVFEHVADLRVVLGECYRALRPGGLVVAAFPPYFGPRAHHLDFITTLPFLHHVFSVATLVEASNDVVARHPEIEREPFDEAPRDALPTLNGTTFRALGRMLRELDFEVVACDLVPFAWGDGGALKRAVHVGSAALAALPWPFTKDVFGSFVRCVLRKPEVR